MRKKIIEYINVTAFTFSAAAHGMAFLQFHFLFDSLKLPPEWYVEVGVMIGVSLMVSMLLLFFRQRMLLTFFLLVCRFAIILIIGYPLGNYVGVELTLLTALVLETVLYTAKAFGVVLSMTAITASLFFQRESLAWGNSVSKASVENMLYLGLYPMIVMVLVILIKRYKVLATKLKQYAERLKKSGSRLVEVNLELQEHVIRKEEEAVLRERKRLSREIHDIIGHTLMSIILMMKAAIRLSDKTNRQLHEFLLQTRGGAQKGLDETRQALRELRSFDAPQISLVSAVNRLIKAFQGTYVDVKAEFGNIPWSFDEHVNSVIYRIVQEGITNAIRHGDAQRIFVFFWYENDTIRISVQDDGCGCDDFIPGLGMKGIQERVSEFKGHLETSSSTEGFKLIVYIPLRRVG